MIKDQMEEVEIILKLWVQGLIEKWLPKNEKSDSSQEKYQTRGRKKLTSDLKTKNENNYPTEQCLRNL